MSFAFWKKEPEEKPTPSTSYEEERFNESYSIVSRNANFILVTNGVLLSIILAIEGSDIYNSILQISSLFKVILADSSITIFNSSTAAFTIYLFFLYSVILGAIFISIISCIGCFNSGLYPRMGRRRSKQELMKREKIAIRWYRISIIALFYCLLGLLNYLLAIIIGGQSYAYIISIFLFVALTIAIIFLGVFSRFEDAEDPSKEAEFKSILAGILFLLIIGLIIVIFA